MDLTYLSLGAGVQSSVLALLLERGELGLPPPEVALFADTGWEPANVYTHLSRLEEALSFPVHRLRGPKTLRQAAYDGDRIADMPLYLIHANGQRGMRNRRCTKHFKIRLIHRWLREHLGVPTLRGKHITGLLGISLDEPARMRTSHRRWEHNRYPLIDPGRLTRRDCLAWWDQHGLGYPLVRSACITCPYHGNSTWKQILLDPEQSREAIQFDTWLRSPEGHQRLRLPQGTQAYLHQDATPLEAVQEALHQQPDLFTSDRDGFGNDCSGYCGV